MVGADQREPSDRRHQRGVRQHLLPVLLYHSISSDVLLRPGAYMLYGLLAVRCLFAVVQPGTVSPDGHHPALILHALGSEQPRAQPRVGVLPRKRPHLYHHLNGDFRCIVHRPHGHRRAQRRRKADVPQTHPWFRAPGCGLSLGWHRL